MTQSLSHLPPHVKEKIISVELTGYRKHHMPIHIYGSEMGEKADLLREHASIYQELLNFNIHPLADEIDAVKEALYHQELTWIDGVKEQDEKTRFWHSNKDTLYDKNEEFRARLSFLFTLHGNSHALEVLDSIGRSENHDDAVHDFRRYVNLMNENHEAVAGNLYSSEEILEFNRFCDDIADAQVAAEVHASAPNTERILRDKIYIHLRSLESIVRKAAKGAFFDNKKELIRYSSSFKRKENQKFRAKNSNSSME